MVGRPARPEKASEEPSTDLLPPTLRPSFQRSIGGRIEVSKGQIEIYIERPLDLTYHPEWVGFAYFVTCLEKVPLENWSWLKTHYFRHSYVIP